MKLTHIIGALALAITLPLAIVVAPAYADDPPVAPLALTGPANGSTVASGKPTFAWTPIAGADQFDIVIATKPTTDATGMLVREGKNYVVDVESVAGTASHSKPTTFAPGTYYWQVAANVYTANTNINQAYLSAVTKFVIPAKFSLTKFAAKVSTNPANGLNEVEVNGRLACNLTSANSPMTIAIKVYKGKKKVGSQTRDGGYCMGSKSTKQFLNFQPRPGAIKKGSKLTVEVVASNGKAHSATTTVKLTWK